MKSMNLEDNDATLWASASRDDRSAFEKLVKRHQSAVCAVAYNSCGNLSISEEIAQEAFWVAWRDRASLLDPARVRAWLCGIARNLARNSRRQTQRIASSLEDLPEPAAATQEPSELIVSREEETLVWNALEQIPEVFREPLILFYRENQSVAEVAATLELTPNAVKQRLSRGRNLLRDQVAEMVEGTLRRSCPRGRFTVSVMAGLTSAAAMTGTASAASGSVISVTGFAAKAIPAASVTPVAGTIGALAGGAGGFLGSWLGIWVPAQMAPTNRERQYLMVVGRRMIFVSIAMSLCFLLLMLAYARTMEPFTLAMVIVGWVVGLNAYILVETFIMVAGIRKIRKETTAESDPNNSWLKASVQRNVFSQTQGRSYRSSTCWLGLPLIDIQVSDPGTNGPRKKARGWIAIGDNADGVILAIGGVARGAIALGGLSLGLVSFGGLSLGLLTLGGCAFGLVAFGGLAIGGISFGGLAIGWDAGGGGAVAWDVACGGAAYAQHAAKGGLAVARDYAVGGSARAAHANDDAAKQRLNSHWLVRSIEWYADHNGLAQFVLIAICVIPSIAIQPLMYKRRVADAAENSMLNDERDAQGSA